MPSTSALEKLKKAYGQYAPWLSLGLGVLARALSSEGVDFAPKAIAILAFAWLLPIAASRWLRVPPEGKTESKLHNLLRTASPTVTVMLYKNVLFFLVPIWFGSAHVFSINVVMPLVLAGMALFTCFSHAYREAVLDEPRIRVLWTAVVLFAALVPATAVIAFTSPRTSIMISALVASTMAWAALAPRETLVSKKGLVTLAQIALPAALLLGLAAPLFPPVPMLCHDHGAGTALANRELVGRAKHFAQGTGRVYAWFAVTLPKRDRQRVTFQWYHEGVAVGAPVHVTVVGGRKEGFRTSTNVAMPAIGSWRVDLLTDRSSQLIGRTSFEVDPS
jgi:hypothetical protein